MSLDILLIEPPQEERRFRREGFCESSSVGGSVFPPLKLTYIAAVLLKSGYNVRIIDCCASGLSLKKLKQHITREYDVFIVNTSTPSLDVDLRTATMLKKEYPQSKLVAVGRHVVARPQDVLTNNIFDVAIVGEPESVISELIQSIKEMNDLDEVPGIAYCQNGVIKKRPQIFVEDLDILPFPARHLLPRKGYHSPVVTSDRFTTIITSRGCPYNCMFCTASFVSGFRWRTRSVGNILQELEMVKRDGVKEFIIVDEVFTLDQKRVFDLCTGLEELNMLWQTEARVDQVTPKLLTAMYNAGCSKIGFGMESGSQVLLDLCGKHITISQIVNVFRWCREIGLEIIANLVIGLPGETKATINETLHLLERLDPDYLHISLAIPFPGTRLYDYAIERGLLIDEDWSLFDINKGVMRTEALSLNELRDAVDTLYKRFYLRPSYVLKRLRHLKSLSQLLVYASSLRNLLGAF